MLVNSTYKPSGPSRGHLSLVSVAETRSISIPPPPWLGCKFPHSMKLASTHFYTCVERRTVKVRCLAQKHNAMSPVTARTYPWGYHASTQVGNPDIWPVKWKFTFKVLPFIPQSAQIRLQGFSQILSRICRRKHNRRPVLSPKQNTVISHPFFERKAPLLVRCLMDNFQICI